MELITQGFSQKILDKYTWLRLFTLNFSPLISTKGFVLFLSRWIELVYALPYIILTREILTSSKEPSTITVLQPFKQIWNILVHLERIPSSSQYGQQPPSYLVTQPPAKARISWKNFNIFQPQNMALLNLRTNYLSQGMPLTLEKSDIKHYPYKPVEEQSLTAKPFQTAESRVQDIQRQLSTADRQLQLTSHQLLSLSYKPSTISQAVENYLSTIKAGTPQPSREEATNGEEIELSDKSPRRYPELESIKQKRPGFRRAELNLSELDGIEHIHYRNFPKMDFVTSGATPELVRNEMKVEKEAPQKPAQLSKTDMNRLTDEVYRLLERKIRIERERRGL
jgi:Tfp pilus assembly protein FimV